MKQLLFLVLLLHNIVCSGQDTIQKHRIKTDFSGGLDIYYGYQFDIHSIDPYMFSSSRHNNLSVNLAYLECTAAYKKVEAKIVPAVGNFMQDNYGSLESMYQVLAEGYITYNAFRKIRISAGIIPSPFGCESAYSSQQWTYSRALSSEYSPYFVSGIRATYIPTTKWSMSIFALNGWNVTDQDPYKAAAFQLQRTSSKVTANVSLFAGKELDSKISKATMRYFIDSYVACTLNKRIATLALIDVGYQNSLWWISNFMLRYMPYKNFFITARFEYGQDRKSVIFGEIMKPNPLSAYSCTIDYWLQKNLVIRTEVRYISSSPKPWILTNINVLF